MSDAAHQAVPAPAVDPVGFAAAAAYNIPPQVAAQTVPPPLPPSEGPFDPAAAGAAIRQSMAPGLRFATETLRGMTAGDPALERAAAAVASNPRFFGLG